MWVDWNGDKTIDPAEIALSLAFPENNPPGDDETEEDLVSSFRTAPRDVHTVPTDGREPVWFYTYVQRGALYVESGRDHSPKSRISGRHRINEAEYQVMLNLYHRRKRGEAVSREASEATLCQVYWYGIFADLGL
jgi:hypothetical protein